ncbi:MAG: hypothetical protein R3C61_11995 [Bacteroidia bacterium]
MTSKQKKIIAREFLIFIAALGISVIAFIGTYPYNYFLNRKIDRIKEETKSLKDRIYKLEIAYNQKTEKQRWFYNESVRKGINGNFRYSSQLWERLEELQKSDSIIFNWNNVWEKELIEIIQDIGFKNGEEFNRFILDNSVANEDSNDKVNEIRRKVNSIEKTIWGLKSRILDTKEQIRFGLIFFAIISTIAFPIRYLFFAIRWSIKTLKEQE